jgi:hypothetical protein
MDFIKKHYEKIVLAGALVALIGSAAFLAFKASALNEEVEGTIRTPKPKGRLLEPVDIGTYTNAIGCLQAPPVWADGPDFFSTGDVDKTPVNIAAPIIQEPTKPQIVLQSISRKPFKLIFQSYMGDGKNFAINLVTRSRTFFVPEVGMKIADRFEETGYVIRKFEHKTATENVPGLGQREVDVSELTIQHEGDDPIVLVLNRLTEEKEPVATIQCTEGNQTLQVSRQQSFDCGGKSYIVVDITSTQLIIMDKKSREKLTITVPRM